MADGSSSGFEALWKASEACSIYRTPFRCLSRDESPEGRYMLMSKASQQFLLRKCSTWTTWTEGPQACLLHVETVPPCPPLKRGSSVPQAEASGFSCFSVLGVSNAPKKHCKNPGLVARCYHDVITHWYRIILVYGIGLVVCLFAIKTICIHW
jgi:hypothetical protein